MPLGDSITHGGAGNPAGGGYRPALWDRLAGHADVVDFVGGERNGRLPDPDHEGHWGWKIDGLLSRIDTWLPKARPNVVLLHIGTNDMHDDYRVDTAPERLGTLVDRITTAAPDMTVLVSALVPSADPATQRRVEAFNAALPALVAERRGRGARVGLVRMDHVTPRDLVDDLHPNDTGNAKMAAAFHEAIARAATAGWIREQVDIGPSPAH
ncbi:SGNH/GDSL hydrolase family protein [Streptomyces huiliensis]|uniref:SGNH/GDSL hydrolase family protein n=1 Tax=Streptomyces huiliensis TaxID=2876027 RepID=UPI001CBED8F2|nr:SGNH/GDSL hydrolase family protein [Streptomyces huiliensis]MBZ4324128.1 SGNH/GDSL hydrolase family protein [Streptomyces huiliensis]